MEVIDRLIAAVRASKMKQWHIAADANMTAEKLSKIVNRKQVPSLPEFIDIARAIGLEPARLFTGGEVVVELERLRAAHALSAQAAATFQQLTEQLATMLPVAEEAVGSVVPDLQKRPRDRRTQAVRAAADPNAELLVEREPERKRIPVRAWNLGARIIARVVGESMDGGADPIHDGELAYLKPTRSPRNVLGEIALVRWEEGLYLKIFEMSGPTIRLVSANPAADPIELDARAENLQIYGYVVAHAPEA
jgi:phage repressor protein C with HTH and peptisase S24 domain